MEAAVKIIRHNAFVVLREKGYCNIILDITNKIISGDLAFIIYCQYFNSYLSVNWSFKTDSYAHGDDAKQLVIGMQFCLYNHYNITCGGHG